VLIYYQGDREKVVRAVGPVLDSTPGRPPVKLWRVGQGSIPDPGNGVLLSMGGDPLKVLQNLGVYPKNRTVTSLRGKLTLGEGGHKFLCTYSPGSIAADPSKLDEIRWDVRLALRAEMTGKLTPEVGAYKYVDSFGEIIDYIQSWTVRVPTVLDLETMGVVPQDPGAQIVCIGVTVKPGESHVIYTYPEGPTHEQLEEIDWLLNSPKVKLWGANFGGFDLNWLRIKWGLSCTNYTLDTTLIGSLLNENRPNNLNLHAKLYTPIGGYDDEFNEKHDKAHMEKVPKDEMLPYIGGDTDACFRVAQHMRAELVKHSKLTKFYQHILHPAQIAFAKMEARGIPVNVEAFAKLRSELVKEENAAEQEALAMLTPRIKAKYADDLSLSRPALLRDFLFTPLGLNLKPVLLTEKKQEPKTSKEHLDMFETHPVGGPFAQAMGKISKISKARSTYIDGFLSHLRQDGLFHPSYMLFSGVGVHDDKKRGTVTGRLACTAPAMQTLPKHGPIAKRLRKCYTAPEGYSYWQVDYSEGELRIVATLAHERAMLEAYNQGMSLHAKTAAARIGMPLPEFMLLKESDPGKYSAARSGAKAANFGFVYRMSAGGFVVYCWSTWGQKITMAMARHERELFFDTYPDLNPWYERVLSYARERHQIESPLGRIRHLPLINSRDDALKHQAERQAINSPVQSMLSDLMLWSIAEIEEEVPEAGLVAMTHDSVTGIAKTEDLPWILLAVKEICENRPIEKVFGYSPALKFPVDFEAGPSWGELEEVKLAA